MALRPLLFLLYLALLAAPAIAACGELARDPAGWAAWGEIDRLADLAANTVALAALSILLAVPVGTATAVVLERVPVPGRPALRGLAAVGLFVPLSVYAVAWQVVLGSWLPALTLEPGAVAWRPWRQGLLPAAWVHGMAAVPWVAWIVAAGLRQADRGLEDEATVTGGPAAVARLVLLPRVAVAAVAAAGWVAAQTATEIPVSDAMMVRTFAEEVYTQVVGYPAGVAAVVAVTIPVWLISVLVAAVIVPPLANRFFPADAEPGPPRPLKLPPLPRALVAVGVWLAAAVFAGLPLAALAWKTGDTSAGWSGAAAAANLGRVVRLNGLTIADSFLWAVAAGVLAAGLAVAACWAARGRRGWSAALLVLTVAAWLTPGPVVGFGLKELIGDLVAAEDHVLSWLGQSPTFPPLRSALYDQPSPLPGVWAAVVRFFPVAVAVVWPVVRSVPRGLLEAATIDGAGPVGTWRLVGWPLTRRAFAVAAAAVAVLALGEVSAGKLVAPPGRTAYILELFNQMHYGAEAVVAAMCLVQLAVTAAGTAVLLMAVERSARLSG